MMLTENVNTILTVIKTIFDKKSLYEERDSSYYFYYLLIDSDILRNVVDLVHIKEGGGI